MRAIGFILLIVGFLWIGWHGVSFTPHQYTRARWRAQQLPEGERIPRSDAVREINNLGLDLNEYQRTALVPAGMMVIGGLILGCRGKPGDWHGGGTTSK